jgi:two-component system, cell cycle sensor histidine kinase and response regulator CckA
MPRAVKIVRKLAVHSRDATPTGGKWTIETRNIELDDSYLHEQAVARPDRDRVYAVSGTATGVSAKTKSHMIETFFVDPGDGAGTTLRLATVHGTARRTATRSDPSRRARGRCGGR